MFRSLIMMSLALVVSLALFAMPAAAASSFGQFEQHAIMPSPSVSISSELPVTLFATRPALQMREHIAASQGYFRWRC